MNTTFALILVLSSAVAHSSWNLFMKQSVHKESFLWLIQTIATIIFMPFFLYELITVDLSFHKVILLLISFFFQSVYLLLLTKAYKMGEMSQVYPMMRGSAALLIPFISMIFYKEQLKVYSWIGLGLMVIGLFLLSGIFKNRLDKNSRLIILITGTVGLSITGYTVIDKSIITYMTPLGLLQVYNLAGFFSLGMPALRSKKLKEEWERNKWNIIIGAIMAPSSYLLFLTAMKYAPLSYISPIRELSIVTGSILGWIVLKEKQGIERIGYSIIILVGIIIISFLG